MGVDLELEIHTPQELNQSSYFRTGLFETEALGSLKCRVILDTSSKRGRLSTKNDKVKFTDHPFPKASYYRLIDNQNKRSIYFAIDGYDIAYYFSDFALKNCDFIFKRHYNKKCLAPLDAKTRKKIFPLGLTFPSVSTQKHGDLLFLLGTVVSNIRLIKSLNLNIGSRVSGLLTKNMNHWKYAMRARKIDDFNAFSYDNEPFVIFQTRCFEQHHESDVYSIHEQRADVIRTLKKQLGPKFKGGFIPNETSIKHYPDCLTNMPTDPNGYLQLVKKASIGIYTRGLQYSPAWKLPEYLSQAKCIVAEPLTTELPVPLEHGKHLLYFNSPEECAGLCEMLLNDPEKMRELSRNARAYYEAHVDPVVNVQRILNLMLESHKDS